MFKVIKRNSRTRQEEIKSRSYKLIMETPACTMEWHSSVFFNDDVKYISFSQLALKFLALTLPGIYSLECYI